jgi:prepilin peptidase CpaA
MPAGSISLALLSVFCLVAVGFDLRRHAVPNWLNAVGLCSGLVPAYALGGMKPMAISLMGSMLGASLMLPFFLLRMVGGGDLKFLAASGALAGWRLLMPAVLIGMFLGGAASVVMLARRDRCLERIRMRTLLLRHGSLKAAAGGEGISGLGDIEMPYTLPLSIGLLMTCASACWG